MKFNIKIIFNTFNINFIKINYQNIIYVNYYNNIYFEIYKNVFIRFDKMKSQFFLYILKNVNIRF